MFRRPITRRTRPDGNKAAIVRRLESHGVSVVDLDWPFDFVCGLRGVTFLADAKNPGTAYGRSGWSDAQARFLRQWRGGPVYELRTDDDVDRAVAQVRRWASVLRDNVAA